MMTRLQVKIRADIAAVRRRCMATKRLRVASRGTEIERSRRIASLVRELRTLHSELDHSEH
jgi:hypothetical protein